MIALKKRKFNDCGNERNGNVHIEYTNQWKYKNDTLNLTNCRANWVYEWASNFWELKMLGTCLPQWKN